GDAALDRLGDRLAVVVELGEAQRAERQADAGPDRRRCGGIDPHQLDAAAAEIADHAIGVADPGQDAGRREPGFLAALDDAYRDAQLALCRGGEGLAVARLA